MSKEIDTPVNDTATTGPAMDVTVAKGTMLEDNLLANGNLNHTVTARYTLRHDVILSIVAVPNELSVVLGLRAVIFPPHYVGLANLVSSKALDWSFPACEPAGLYDGFIAFAPNLAVEQYRHLFTRHPCSVQKLYFFHHQPGATEALDHWIIFKHSLTDGDATSTCIDSLAEHRHNLDIQHQILLREFFRVNRLASAVVAGCSTGHSVMWPHINHNAGTSALWG